MSVGGIAVMGLVVAAIGGAVVACASPVPSPSDPPSPSPSPTVRMYAPYVEMWLGDRVTDLAQASGTNHFTLAFLESTGTTSCEVAWNGSTKLDDTAGRQIAEDAATLRASGGDVIPSFGGYSADHEGREIADSCADPEKIADAYMAVIDALGATRLDMDVEVESLDRPDGIDRRNRAIRILQDRLAADSRTVEIQYTIPTGPNGPGEKDLATLRSAIQHGARVDVVNIMVFDYYDGRTRDMGAAAISAAQALHDKLGELYPERTSTERWAMIGLTLMPGIDDYPEKTEITTLDDARRIAAFAGEQGLSHLSIWAIQRDNGDCPGAGGNGTCSGIDQEPWAFSKILGQFTGSTR